MARFLRNGSGNSTNRRIDPRTIAAACTRGNSTITKTKGAAAFEGLDNTRVKTRMVKLRDWVAYSIPPGSLKVPPTKSQKNLRKKIPQNADQIASMIYLEFGCLWKDKGTVRTYAGRDGNEMRPVVPH
jgi:site-specific recombinase XerC